MKKTCVQNFFFYRFYSFVPININSVIKRPKIVQTCCLSWNLNLHLAESKKVCVIQTKALIMCHMAGVLSNHLNSILTVEHGV